MKCPLFDFPSYRYEIDDWESKKKELLKQIDKQEFVSTKLQCFETDRQTNDRSYIHDLEKILRPTLIEFCEEEQVNCVLKDAWCVKYKKGDHQTIHNHRSCGYSGILYLQYDPEVHTPTCFMAPWQNPKTDQTSLSYPLHIKEGVVFISPSSTHHFVEPNMSDKQRTVIAFDLVPIMNYDK